MTVVALDLKDALKTAFVAAGRTMTPQVEAAWLALADGFCTFFIANAFGTGGVIGGGIVDGTYGDVTVSLLGTIWTVGNNKITNAKLAQAAAHTLKGNSTGSTANVADLTTTQVKTLLAIAASDVSGLAAVATSGSAADLTTGTLPAGRFPALTGDVTTSAGALATTIAASAVTNAKLANAAANTLKGNNTGSPAAPVDLTTAQVKTLLAIAASDVSGLAAIATSGSGADLTANTVTNAKLAQAAANTLKGNNTAGTANVADLTTTQVKALLAITTGDVSGLAAIATTGSGADLTASSVTNAKLANMATLTLKGNNTGGSTTPSDLTAAQAKTLLAIAAGDVSGLAAIATSGSATDLGTGTVPAGRMPALTGDVTTSAGAVATTITASSVTNAKLANMAASTIKGNNTAGPAAPTDLTATQVKTLLAIAASDVSGLATIATSGNANDLGAGTLPAGRFPALTGDVTTSAGALGTTIAAHAVTNAKAAQMSANTIKGNNTAGTADAADLTVAQVKTLLAIAESDVTNLTTDLASKVPTTRNVNTTAPLTGGGNLSADLTFAVSDFIASGVSHARGTVPDPGATAGGTRYLREDASWAQPPMIGSRDAGTQRVQTEQFVLQYRRLTLSSSERLTLEGTSEVFLDDFDAYTEAWQTQTAGQVAIGSPFVMQTDAVLPAGYFFVQYQRLSLEKSRRLTMQGERTDFILTDFTTPAGRLVAQGRF